jgi:hypothetical protein
MNKSQHTTWNLLLLLIIVVVAFGAFGEFLAGVIDEIATHHKAILNFNPNDRSGTQFENDATNRPNGAGQQTNAPTRQFDIPLLGGGSMHVNASDLAAAIKNVISTGNTPAVTA